MTATRNKVVNAKAAVKTNSVQATTSASGSASPVATVTMAEAGPVLNSSNIKVATNMTKVINVSL